MRIATRKPRNDQRHRSKTDPYYQSSEWRAKKDKVWKRDKGLCQICLEKGIMHQLQRGTKNLERQGTVEHNIPRNAGGSDELDNLWLMGSNHHPAKSNQDKKLYN